MILTISSRTHGYTIAWLDRMMMFNFLDVQVLGQKNWQIEGMT